MNFVVYYGPQVRLSDAVSRKGACARTLTCVSSKTHDHTATPWDLITVVAHPLAVLRPLVGRF